MTSTPTDAAVGSMNSLMGRWRYLPKLVGLLWRLAPWDLVSIGVFSFLSGLVPVGAICPVVLFDSTVDLIAGHGDPPMLCCDRCPPRSNSAENAS